jgi:di/tricarboxylate transporter
LPSPNLKSAAMELIVIFALMLCALVLLSLERVPVDMVALGILVTLMLTGILTPREALSGFSQEAVVVLAGLFVLAAAVRATGSIDALGRSIARVSKSPTAAIAIATAVVALVSAFINNTTTTALFLPVFMLLARQAGLSSSKVLMPMAFASILGGTLTVIGTSTNVIVRGLMPDYGLEPLAMFELTPVALPVVLAGLVYLALAAKRLLPEGPPTPLLARYTLEAYLGEVTVLPDSPLVGRTVEEADLRRKYELNLIQILRPSPEGAAASTPTTRLRAGDVLLIHAPLEALLRLTPESGLAIALPGREPTPAADLELLEAVVPPRSVLVGRTLSEIAFRQRFGANVVALRRDGHAVVEKLSRIRLAVGDVVLLQAGREETKRLLAQNGLLTLSPRPVEPGPSPKRLPAVVFGGVIVAGATGIIPLPAAVLLGCLLVFALRAITPEEAYRAIDWRLLVLVAGMVAYGVAMQKTGAAGLAADWIAAHAGGLGERGTLAAFYVLTLALTQPMSNQAAALVVFPVAMQTALATGIDPRAMAVTVTLAASCSFLTPLEPSCLLVYGPGGYRFWDFAKLGLALTAISMVLTLAIVPLVWS